MAPLSVSLILLAAVVHAVWNILAKGIRGNGTLFVWWYGLVSSVVLIPVSLLQNSTAKKAEGGRTILMHVPPSTEVAGEPTTAAAFPDPPRNIGTRDAEVRAEHKDDTLGRATQ